MQAKPLTTYVNKTVIRTIAAIVIFVVAMVLAARIRIPLSFTPVPITLQPLVVILSGLVLGARSGAVAQLGYLGLIAAGLPVDTNALGPAAFLGPTAGYLVGFVPAAFVAGWLAERFAVRNWWGNFLAGIAGMLVLYLVGATWLAVLLQSWQNAWIGGVAPFIVLDLIKAAAAAGVAESGKLLLSR